MDSIAFPAAAAGYPAKCRWRKAGTHVGKRRWCGNRFRRAESHVDVLIAVKRNAVAAQQPVGKLGLPLAKKFEIEIPNALDRLHPGVSMFLLAYHLLHAR